MSLTVRAEQNGRNGLEMTANTVGVKQRGENGKSVFAGTLMVPSQTDSLVEQKRQSAKNQAKKLVNEAWGKDQKLLQKIDEKWGLWEDKMSQIKKSEGIISDIEEAKARLKEQYEIDPESQEQKDLDLLEKYQDWRNGVNELEFSKEERSRLKELQDLPMTEYQMESLKINDDSGKEKANIQKLQWEAGIVKGSISDDKLKQAISQDMLKAQETADQIEDAAGKEVMNLLIQEIKDKMDQETEEEKEKAEEIQEKKEEQQEQIDKIKENKKEQEELVEGDLKADQLQQEFSLKQKNYSNMESTQNTIRRMMKDNNLVDEDLKGIEIDFLFTDTEKIKNNVRRF
ncbi:MAG: hypothetical protein HFI70_16045 [Lachnospiraceae bacterium]|nr:hypothetical protein [Lachnospiraceae bacterium]